MNQWLQLDKRRRIFLAPLRAASFPPVRAITFLLIAKACLTCVVAQVTPVPPFVGTHSETWEEFGVRSIPSGTSILGGIAMISGDHMVTATHFDMCGHIGMPSDGDILMGSARPTGPLTISFSQAVSAFGAYWGSSIHCYNDPATILTFRDAAGNIIGTDTFSYIGYYEGELIWHGYQFGTPVTTIRRTAADGQDTIVMDGLQATVGPSFFTGETALGNGIYYLQFPNGTPFGYYSYLTDPHWIYHFDMGYEYWFDASDGQGGIYFYDLASTHFFYTSPSFPFPYLYDFSLNTVLYYFPDPNNPGHYTTNPRYFYNFATGQIITM